MWPPHFPATVWPYERQPLKMCVRLIKKKKKKTWNVAFVLPIRSRRLGSSETRSNLPRKPRNVLNVCSRTVLSGSTVSVHKAGKIRYATSDSRKYCCVVAKAKTPAPRAGGNESLMARINADTSTRWRTWNTIRIRFVSAKKNFVR